MAIRAERRSLLGRVWRHNASQPTVVDWTPHRDGGAMAWLRSRNPHVTFVAGALTGTLLIGASVWLTGGHTISFASFGETQVANTVPRYAPLNLTKQSSPVAKSEPESAATPAEQMARIVAEEVIELQVGQRARLAVRIDDAEKLKPETVALVSGLPEDVQLSDGIRINAQLWMLRPTLLGSVEVEAARGPVGRYPLTLELRTPEGLVISSATTTLAIAATRDEKPSVSQSQDTGASSSSVSATPAPAKVEVGADAEVPRRRRAAEQGAGAIAGPVRGHASRADRLAQARAEVTVCAPKHHDIRAPCRRAGSAIAAATEVGLAWRQSARGLYADSALLPRGDPERGPAISAGPGAG